MTKALYMKNSYLKEFNAKVISVNDRKFIVLDKTAFYPNSGGQLNDIGVLIRKSDGQKFKVVFVGKFSGEISHEIEPIEGKELNEGDEVQGIIEWDRRYLMMRYHTAAHVFSGVIEHATGALITGNQLKEEKARIDFSLEEFNRGKMAEYVEKANEIIAKELPVKIEFLTREQAEQEPSLAKLAKGLPEAIKEIRVVEVEGFDRTACGGTHVANISEIKGIELVDIQNKGKNNRRVYFKLKE